MPKKSGFTLVELLAVIVVLAIVTTAGGMGTMAVLNRVRRNTAKEMQNNLSEVAISYAMDSLHIQKCSVDFSKEVYEQNDISHLADNTKCTHKLTVDELEQKGLFEDNRNYCQKTDYVIVYRYASDETHSEYKTYIPTGTCSDLE